MRIPFNIPYTTGRETEYIQKAIESGHLSGNGPFTKKCQSFFENKYGFRKTLLTSSCTDALEMAAMLIDIKSGDEVIIPAYTFVSTALAFVRQGAVIRFVDSRGDHPGMDEMLIESLINKHTRAIVAVHYAGVACDMDIIMELADRYKLFVIEDAAHSIDSYYKNRPLGGIGHMACFSFHETKGIHSGEGGMLVVNDERLSRRADIIWEKGTNRVDFFNGKVSSNGWVDTGSSFLPSEITSAFLFAQLEELEKIQERRLKIWNTYHSELTGGTKYKTAKIPGYASNNAHMFYLNCESENTREGIIDYLKKYDIQAVFHYLGLHKSIYNKKHGLDAGTLSNADRFEERIVRLPFYPGLKDAEIKEVATKIRQYFSTQN